MFRRIWFRCVLLFTISSSLANLALKFYKVDCVFYPEYVENGTCNLKVLRRDLVIANVDYDLKKSMNNVTVHFHTFKLYSQFRPFLIDSWLNLCEVSEEGGYNAYNFFVKLLYRIAKRTSNNAIICNHTVSLWKSIFIIFYTFFSSQATIIFGTSLSDMNKSSSS